MENDAVRHLPELPGRWVLLGIAIAFLALLFTVYGKSLGNDFVRMDDGLLIFENQFIREISWKSLKTVFMTYDPELYIPMTFIAYQIDYQFSGLHAFGYHLTNLLLHTLNALLVLWFLYLLIEDAWIALLVAAVFAVHPLSTEAVAWAAALKDVLSTAFFLGSLIAYVYYLDAHRAALTGAYVETPRVHARRSIDPGGKNGTNIGGASLRRYALSFFLFLLGLLSKVMVITFPVVLILLDLYEGRRIDRRMLLEKIPFIVLSIIFGIVAMFGKTSIIAESSPWEKILVGSKSAVFYLEKLFWPSGLSVMYPYTKPVTILSPDFFVPVIIVLALIGLALFALRGSCILFQVLSFRFHDSETCNPKPETEHLLRIIFFGLAWYFITLIPTTLNLIKGGEVVIASDRYAYIPSIGGLVIVAALLLHWARRSHRARPVLLYTAIPVLILLSFLSFRQSLVWAKTEDLFRNVLAFYPDSYRARNNVGNALRRRGEADLAIEEFKLALAIKPTAKTYDNLGATYRKKGMFDEAVVTHQQATLLAPLSAEPHIGLALVYVEQGRVDAAFMEYNKAIALQFDDADAYINRGVLREKRGDADGAISDYRRAIAINPIYGYAHYNLAVILNEHGQTDEALREYEEAVSVQPTLLIARINLGILYAAKGRLSDARKQFAEILILDPGNQVAQKAIAQIDSALKAGR